MKLRPSTSVLILAVALACLLAPAAFSQNPVPQIVGPLKRLTVAPGGGQFKLTVYGVISFPERS